jgi:hypothetical protein
MIHIMYFGSPFWVINVLGAGKEAPGEVIDGAEVVPPRGGDSGLWIPEWIQILHIIR